MKRSFVLSLILMFAAFSAMAASPKEPAADTMCGRKVVSVHALEQELQKEKLPLDADTRDYIGYSDERAKTLWTFTKLGHVAHPSVVCRHIVEQKDGIAVDMNVRCSADQNACDALVAEFKQLSENMKQAAQQQ